MEAIFLDLANPTNPVYLGEWNEEYIHDGMVRGDTMWAGCVYVVNLYVWMSLIKQILKH